MGLLCLIVSATSSPHRLEVSAIVAARRQIFRPQTSSFLDSTSTMGFGVKVHFLLSQECAMLGHVWNHYSLTVTCLQ